MPQPSALLSAKPSSEQNPNATTWGERRDVPANVKSEQTVAEYIDAEGQKTGWWSNFPAYIRSLLKAWYGEAADEEDGNTCYRWIPKITGDHSHLATSDVELAATLRRY